MVNFSEISSLKPIQAQGFLARAALAVQNDLNPASKPQLDREMDIRSSMVERLRMEAQTKLGINDQNAIDDLVSDWITDAIDSSSTREDDDSAFERLSERGDLPADAFTLKFSQSLIDTMLIFDDRDLIRASVHSPEMENHWQEEGSNKRFTLIGKWFDVEYPDPFFLVSFGVREGRQLRIDNSFRLYPSEVTFLDVSDLQTALERFALAYKTDFRLQGHRDVILRSVRFPGSQLKFAPGSESGTLVGVVAARGDHTEVVWGFAYNHDKYQRSLARHLRRKKIKADKNSTEL